MPTKGGLHGINRIQKIWSRKKRRVSLYWKSVPTVPAYAIDQPDHVDHQASGIAIPDFPSGPQGFDEPTIFCQFSSTLKIQRQHKTLQIVLEEIP